MQNAANVLYNQLSWCSRLFLVWLVSQQNIFFPSAFGHTLNSFSLSTFLLLTDLIKSANCISLRVYSALNCMLSGWTVPERILCAQNCSVYRAIQRTTSKLTETLRICSFYKNTLCPHPKGSRVTVIELKPPSDWRVRRIWHLFAKILISPLICSSSHSVYPLLHLLPLVTYSAQWKLTLVTSVFYSFCESSSIQHPRLQSQTYWESLR